MRDALKIEEEGRVHAKIPADLKQFMLEYAKKNKTTLTALIVRHFETIRRQEATLRLQDTPMKPY